MENNKDYLKENSEDIIDISSFSAKHLEFEDISSNSKKKKGPLSRLYRRFLKWWRKAVLWKKITVIASTAVAAVLILSIGLVGTLYYYIGLDDLNQTDVNESDVNITEGLDKEIVNIALFGIDTRNTQSFSGNSDSIMILSLNTRSNQVKIISIMRDTFVPINHNGKTTYGKINSAYAKGGPKLAIKTLNTLFNLNITDYATVNFFGMMDIIDAVGGIEATLTAGEVSSNLDGMALNGCIKELCDSLGKKASDYYIYKAGTHHLNGIQAVAYSRIRKVANVWGTNNDYGRTDRQRYVMEQLFNRAITMSKARYIELAKSLIPCSETSLNFSDIYTLATDILLDSPTFSQSRIPNQDFLMSSPSGFGSVVYFDLDYAAKLIHSFVYEDISFEDYIATNGIEKNDWYRDIVGDYSATSKPVIEGNSSIEQTVPNDSQTEETASSETVTPEDETDSTVSDEIQSTDVQSCESSSADDTTFESNTSNTDSSSKETNSSNESNTSNITVSTASDNTSTASKEGNSSKDNVSSQISVSSNEDTSAAQSTASKTENSTVEDAASSQVETASKDVLASVPENENTQSNAENDLPITSGGAETAPNEARIRR